MSIWSWRTNAPGSCLNGEFVTRDEAIADARASVGGSGSVTSVLVGEIHDLVPRDYVDALDVDWVLEAMNEAAEMDTSDPVFDTDNGGKTALYKALSEWADEHVTANFDRVTRDEEEVDV